MPTQDEEIARHLREALASGELAGTEGFGKPLPEDAGWDATPESLRMPLQDPQERRLRASRGRALSRAGGPVRLS